MKWGYIPRLRLFMVTLRKANVCALRFHETLRQEHNSFGLHDPSWCDGRDDGCRGLATDREVFETKSLSENHFMALEQRRISPRMDSLISPFSKEMRLMKEATTTRRVDYFNL